MIGAGDPAEAIGVVGEPFGLVTRTPEYQPVLHLAVGLDLRHAGDDLFQIRTVGSLATSSSGLSWKPLVLGDSDH